MLGRILRRNLHIKPIKNNSVKYIKTTKLNYTKTQNNIVQKTIVKHAAMSKVNY